MGKNQTRQRLKYLLFDYLAASVAWVFFYLYRKTHVEPIVFGYEVPLNLDMKFWAGSTILPVVWVILHYLSGFYSNIYRRSRLEDFVRTFLVTLGGVIVVFFILILDDFIPDYRYYYNLFSILFLLQFFLTLAPRMIITSFTIRKIQSRKIGFKTIFIGSNQNALELYQELQQERNLSGLFILGFINVHFKEHYQLQDHIPHLGGIDALETVIREKNIEEVIIALEPQEQKNIVDIITRLSSLDVRITAIPNMTDILAGRVKSTTLFETPLVEVSHNIMPIWQYKMKQLMDVFIALIFSILSIPVIIFLIAGIKLSSPGPILYKQERIGRFGKPFFIYKFRSMYKNAEKNGPELSSKDDPRITRFGFFMRKYRLDEIPNFINLLKGEMSLVGPRPERKYFIDQIVSIAPEYFHLQKVKPGVTSWGQVKYGYAENVNQMIKRLRYDLLYMENMSLLVDIKIMMYTLSTIIRGSGK